MEAVMNTDKVFYTDGHEVTVTGSTLTVHKREYRLLGITRHGLSTLKPSRAPGFMLFIIGMLIVAVGAYRLIPPDVVQPVFMMERWVTANEWAIVLGAILALAGLLFTMLVKPKYAVRIATAEGESDVIVSKHREYIRQIVDGMNRAFVSRGVTS